MFSRRDGAKKVQFLPLVVCQDSDIFCGPRSGPKLCQKDCDVMLCQKVCCVKVQCYCIRAGIESGGYVE